MGDMIQRLRDVAEHYFDCTWGQPRAFFELPQRRGEDIRVTYVVYAVAGNDLAELEQWMIDEVLRPLDQKAGDGSRLYWRNDQCFNLTLIEGDRYYLRTRLAVLDKDLNEVRLDDLIKREGEPPAQKLS